MVGIRIYRPINFIIKNSRSLSYKVHFIITFTLKIQRKTPKKFLSLLHNVQQSFFDQNIDPKSSLHAKFVLMLSFCPLGAILGAPSHTKLGFAIPLFTKKQNLNKVI